MLPLIADWTCLGKTQLSSRDVRLSPRSCSISLGQGSPGTHLRARVPVVADLRLIHNGAIVAEQTGTEINFVPTKAGADRLEALAGY
jgi:hypothetical protein